jgi:hypothetical protein
MDIFPGQEGGQNLFPKMPSQKCPFLLFSKCVTIFLEKTLEKTGIFCLGFQNVAKNADLFPKMPSLMVSLML